MHCGILPSITLGLSCQLTNYQGEVDSAKQVTRTCLLSVISNSPLVEKHLFLKEQQEDILGWMSASTQV